MKRLLFRNFMPAIARAQLWGDRTRWGLVVDERDPDWSEWLGTYATFYDATQRSGIGATVNDAGYSVMRKIDLDTARVLEIGAGDIRHAAWWRGKPSAYHLVDVSTDMLMKAEARLSEAGVESVSSLVGRNERIPADDSSVDAVVSFYSMEHLYPLEPHLEEIKRVLRPGGILVGAIPTEGGLAWGAGRWLTSRRWFKRNTNIDPDKIICWEHPNFADEIIDRLDKHFSRVALTYWPLRIPTIDLNLVVQFVYRT